VKIHPHDLLLQELPNVSPEAREKCLKHLSRCSECREKLSAWRRIRSSTRVAQILPFGRGKSADYEPSLAGLSQSLRSLEEAYRREREGAPRLYAELIQHPIERNTLLVRNCPRFHTWGFCELLLHRSREQNFQDPAVGEGLALLAIEVLDHLDPSLYGAESLEDLRARAWSYVGNSRRVKGDLQGAEEAFSFSLSFLRM
jgi:hypothetical protein